MTLSPCLARLTLVICSLLTACSGGFLVNGVPVKDKELRRYDHTWRRPMSEALSASKFSRSEQEAILNLISFQEYVKFGSGDCLSLSLVQINVHVRRYMQIAERQLGPMHFYEEWRVDACGRKHSWIVVKPDKFLGGPDVYLPTGSTNNWIELPSDGPT